MARIIFSANFVSGEGESLTKEANFGLEPASKSLVLSTYSHPADDGDTEGWNRNSEDGEWTSSCDSGLEAITKLSKFWGCKPELVKNECEANGKRQAYLNNTHIALFFHGLLVSLVGRYSSVPRIYWVGYKNGIPVWERKPTEIIVDKTPWAENALGEMYHYDMIVGHEISESHIRLVLPTIKSKCVTISLNREFIPASINLSETFSIKEMSVTEAEYCPDYKEIESEIFNALEDFKEDYHEAARLAKEQEAKEFFENLFTDQEVVEVPLDQYAKYEAYRPEPITVMADRTVRTRPYMTYVILAKPETRMRCPEHIAGLVIGKGGSNLNRIKPKVPSGRITVVPF